MSDTTFDRREFIVAAALSPRPPACPSRGDGELVAAVHPAALQFVA